VSKAGSATVAVEGDMAESPVQLYEQDFVRWTEQQAAALREAAAAGTNLPLDWENLAEEIDSLGRSISRELRRRIARIIEHLIKLECSPAAPRQSWYDTVDRERLNIEDLLEESPSLRTRVADMVSRQLPRTARLVIGGLDDSGNAAAETVARIQQLNYNAEQVIGDWYPGDDPSPGPLPANGPGDQEPEAG
jgi:hypothetical protein